MYRYFFYKSFNLKFRYDILRVIKEKGKGGRIMVMVWKLMKLIKVRLGRWFV